MSDRLLIDIKHHRIVSLRIIFLLKCVVFYCIFIA